jgi:hypothetical protein
VSHQGITPDDFVRSVELYEHALALDPQSVEANTLLANEGLTCIVMATGDDDTVALLRKKQTPPLARFQLARR